MSRLRLGKAKSTGFMGLSGTTEVCRAICGIDEPKSGSVFLNGNLVRNRTYKEGIKNGFAYLTEDRKAEGLFLGLEHNNQCDGGNSQGVDKRFPL